MMKRKNVWKMRKYLGGKEGKSREIREHVKQLVGKREKGSKKGKATKTANFCYSQFLLFSVSFFLVVFEYGLFMVYLL